MTSTSTRPGPTAPLALLLAAALLATGCPAPPENAGGATTTTASAGPQRGNRLVIGLEQEPDKLNTTLNAMVYGTYINNAIYGYFVRYDETMTLIPDVIEEIPTLENGGISPDGLRYTYRLRKGLTWHDGHPFTADDVVFSVAAIMDMRHEVESRTGYDQIQTTTAPDPHTIVFELKQPHAPFVEEIFFSNGLMPKHLLEASVGTGFGAAPFHRAPVGLGPFRFKQWISGQSVTLEASDTYWRGRPAIDEITFRFIPDTNSLLVALEAGEIDGYDNAGTDQRTRIARVPWVSEHIVPQLMWEHIDFNCEDPILSDVRVRQAIQLAIDRQQISREIYEGLWPPAYGDIAESLSWFNPKVREIVRHDPAAAAALLDEAGWKADANGMRSRDGQKLALSISTTAGRVQRERTEEVLQQQLAAVGIELTIQNHNATAFFAPVEQNGVLKKGKYQLGMYAWITSPDPNKKSLYHSSEVPPQGQNNPRLRDARIDELLETGLTTLDPAKRKVIYDEFQIRLATLVPMTPIVWRSDIDVMPKRLVNYKANPTQNGDTWNIWEWSLRP